MLAQILHMNGSLYIGLHRRSNQKNDRVAEERRQDYLPSVYSVEEPCEQRIA